MSEESGPPPPDSFGTVLQSRRVERGLTLIQAAAATHVRVAHLDAIETGHFELLPAPVYARGYVRTYARYLGVDPEPLVARVPSPPNQRRGAFALGGSNRRPRLVVTGPTAVLIGLAVLASAFILYAWRQVDYANHPGGPAGRPSLQLPAVSPPTTPLPTPSPQPKSIVVGVRVTDTVWLSVIVDGQSQYSDSGRILQSGMQVYFTGFDIRITSGKAAATFITVDDRVMGALGDGVATREFKATG
jgi:cytoskeleton protein RodZ